MFDRYQDPVNEYSELQSYDDEMASHYHMGVKALLAGKNYVMNNDVIYYENVIDDALNDLSAEDRVELMIDLSKGCEIAQDKLKSLIKSCVEKYMAISTKG